MFFIGFEHWKGWASINWLTLQMFARTEDIRKPLLVDDGSQSTWDITAAFFAVLQQWTWCIEPGRIHMDYRLMVNSGSLLVASGFFGLVVI